MDAAKTPARRSAPRGPNPTQRAQRAIAKQQSKVTASQAYGAKMAALGPGAPAAGGGNGLPVPPPMPPKADNMQLMPPEAMGRPLANKQKPLGVSPGMSELFKAPSTANQQFRPKIAIDTGTLGGAAGALGDLGKTMGHMPGVSQAASMVASPFKSMAGGLQGMASKLPGSPAAPPPAAPQAPPAAAPPAGGSTPAGGPAAPGLGPDPGGEAPPPSAGGGMMDSISKSMGGGDWGKALGSLGQGDFSGAWGNTPGYGKLGLGVGGGMLLMMLLKRLFGGGGGEKYSAVQVKQAQLALHLMDRGELAKLQGEVAAVKLAGCAMAPRGSRIAKSGKQAAGKFERGHQFQGTSTSKLASWLQKRAAPASLSAAQRLARARRIQRLRYASNRGSFEEETATPAPV